MIQPGELFRKETATFPMALLEPDVVGPSDTCALLHGGFGWSAQAMLAALTAAMLVLKWLTEPQRRQFIVFMMDVSKQMVGGFIMHVWNLVVSLTIYARGGHVLADECTWYWLNLLVDTTIGVIIVWSLLRLTEIVNQYNTGNYFKRDGSLDCSMWLKQTWDWVLLVLIMKTLSVILVVLGRYPLTRLANAVLHQIDRWHNKQSKLFIVMVVTPFLMNTFQFFITDNFLRWVDRRKPASKTRYLTAGEGVAKNFIADDPYACDI